MSNAKIFFTKSFERAIRVDGAMYKIVQDQQAQELCVYDEHKCIYKMIGKENDVIYDVGNIELITRVLHQAHVDRYALHK